MDGGGWRRRPGGGRRRPLRTMLGPAAPIAMRGVDRAGRDRRHGGTASAVISPLGPNGGRGRGRLRWNGGGRGRPLAALVVLAMLLAGFALPIAPVIVAATILPGLGVGRPRQQDGDRRDGGDERRLHGVEFLGRDTPTGAHTAITRGRRNCSRRPVTTAAVHHSTQPDLALIATEGTIPTCSASQGMTADHAQRQRVPIQRQARADALIQGFAIEQHRNSDRNQHEQADGP